LASDIEEIVAVCKEHGYVLPTVYQGSYSAIARRTETEVFPTLRKHGIRFYAYSPIAGGFLSKSKAELTGQVEGDKGSRWIEASKKDDVNSKLYNGLYNKPSFLNALDLWEGVAQSEGVSRAELAWRWVTYHSELKGEYGDAIIAGARKIEQLRDTVAIIQRGPLSDDAVKRIDEIWDSVKADAYLDNFEQWSGSK